MHRETVRLVPNADTAVLMIHGICGTPNHFRDVIPLEERIPDNISVYNLLLDGHGGTVSDFTASSGRKWAEQVAQVYDILAEEHKEIYAVGHSMGTLFALQLAAAHPEKVKKLFLLAVPMRPCLKPIMVWNVFSLVFGKLHDAPEYRRGLVKASGICTTRKLWKYIPWIPRYLDLFRLISQTENVIKNVTAACDCYQSQRDELVFRRSEKVLGKNEAFKIHKLDDSSHFYYAPDDRKLVLTDFEQWINETHD
jgi:esterase/lipase